MSDKKFNASKFMKFATWSAAIMLFVMVSNLFVHNSTLNLTEIEINVIGYMAPAMLLVALAIAWNIGSGTYLVVISCISLLTTMQYGTVLPSVQAYSLAIIGSIAFMRVLYPIFIRHRDEKPSADVHDIKEATSAAGRPRRQRAS